MSDYITENIGGAVVTRLAIPAPVAPIVPTITSRQGKRALLNAGLYHAALAAINALDEPQRTAALIDWDAPTWTRTDPTVAQIGLALGQTEAQLDALFSAAVLIV